MRCNEMRQMAVSGGQVCRNRLCFHSEREAKPSRGEPN